MSTVKQALFHSINPNGKNKDWDYESLTSGFEDRTGTIADLKSAIKSGYAISGAHFKGQRRKTANVAKVGLLLVDIDDGMTIEEAIADPFIQQYCAIAYTTASHTSEYHKFRLIFPLPEPINRLEFECLAGAFLGQFPNHDPSCKDAGRAFYGNDEAEFFIYNPEATLPQDWTTQAIANAKAEKERLEKERQARLQWLKDNPPVISPDAIPLINCCRREIRALIDDGVPAGSGHNDAAQSVLLELIGVEGYLLETGQSFSGSAREYYDRFLLASGVDNYKAEQRWEWAKARKNVTASIPPAIIQNCIYAYQFNQLRTGAERDQFRKERPDFKPRNDRSTNQRGDDSNKVVSITKNQANPSIQESLESIALSHPSKKNLEVAIANIAKEHDLPIQQVKRIYEETVKEIESQESRDDVKQELSQLLDSQTDAIDLKTFFPHELAESTNKFMGWLNLRPESAATALITGISSALPSQTRIVINRNLGWSESPGFSAGIVASSTQKKSPIMNTFMIRPLAKLQVEENENYQQNLDDYNAQLAEYEELSKSKKDTDQLLEKYPDGPPQPPKKRTWFYTNVTLEKLKAQMAEQPGKGILLAVDELAGLFGNMNAYRSGKGSDRQDLMSMKDGSPVSVGRKNGDVFVESPLLSIFGTIQPKVMQKILGDGNDSDGFFARFCFVRQPTVATILPELTDQSFDISPMIEALYRQVASLKPTNYQLSPEGYAALKEATDAYELKRVAAGEHPIGNVYGKNGGRIGELSMLLHVIKHCFYCETPPDVIALETVKAAIAMVHFYTNQHRALYAELDNQPSSIAPHLVKIINLAKSKGELTPRIVARQLRDMAKVKDQIPAYFQELQDMGLGTIQHGRTLKFTLATDPPTSAEVSTSVNKLSTPVDTSKPIQNKGLDKVSTSVNTKTQFSKTNQNTQKTSSGRNHVDTFDSVDTSEQNLDTASDLPVDTSLTPVDTSLTPVDTSQNSPHPTHNPLDGENEPTGTTVVSEVVSKNQLTPHEVFTLPLDSRIWVKFCGQELTPAIIYGGNDEVLRVGNHGDRIEPDWMLPIKLDDLAQGRISIYAA